MKSKTGIVIALLACCLVAFVVTAIVILHNSGSGTTIKVIATKEDLDGGVTTYEVTGTSSSVEANKAIVMEEYKGDTYYREITEREATEIAEKIDSCGGEKIKGSFIGGPIEGDIKNWRNFYGADNREIVTYLDEDDNYSVWVEGCK